MLTLTAVAAAALVLKLSGAADVVALPGLRPPDGTVPWLLPLLRSAARLAQVAAFGALLAAAVLLPADGGRLSPAGWLAVRLAARACAAWAVLQIAQVPLTAAELLGRSIGSVTLRQSISTALDVSSGRVLAATAGLGAAAALVAAVALSRAAAGSALGLMAAAVVPQAASGHAASSGSHQIAVSGMLLHVAGVMVWAGGLIGLVLVARSAPVAGLAVAGRRFSRLAGTAAAVVILSGVLSAYVRLGLDASNWLGTAYGRAAVAKTAAAALLVSLGALHRRSSLRRLEAGDRTAFRRIGLADAVVFCATLGLAAAMARIAPPPTGRVESLQESVLGYQMPPVITPGRVIGSWYPEPIYVTVVVAAIGLYLAGVLRLRRRGVGWPYGRTVVWVLAWLAVLLATSSGLARYAPVLASAHMAQHLMLTLVAAPLIALSAPVTLALRALRPARPKGATGPREALLRTTQWRATGWLTRPPVIGSLFAFSPFIVYFSGLYELSLRHHMAHLLLLAHFLLTSVLFFTVVIGADPVAGRPGHIGRLMMVIFAAVAHTIFGIVVMQSSGPLAPEWWSDIARPWWPDAREDTIVAGGLAWAFGELPVLFVLAAIVRQWAQDDERQQRRRDRAADMAGSRESREREDYNAMLRRLAGGGPEGS